MRLVLQRVTQASVAAEGVVVSSIGQGVLALIGVQRGDTEKDAAYIAEKIAQMRIFEDEEGKMNRSLLEIGAEALVVSQFTLLGDVRKGRRPSFSDAEDPTPADAQYVRVCEMLEGMGIRVGRGVFGADMQVSLINDGPVTVLLDSGRLF